MAPAPWTWDFAWGEAVVVILVAGAYALAARRYPPTAARIAAFAAAAVLVLALFVTPLGTLAPHYLLSAHLLQNVVLAEWAPALAVLGLSPALGGGSGRVGPVRLLTRPFVALPLWVLSYARLAHPGPYEAALRTRRCFGSSTSRTSWPAACSGGRCSSRGHMALPNGAKAAISSRRFCSQPGRPPARPASESDLRLLRVELHASGG